MSTCAAWTKGEPEKISGNKVKQQVTVKTGVESELAKKIIRLIKDSKLKVQGSIQGEAVRVSGAKRDTLQEAIQLVKKSITEFPASIPEFPRITHRICHRGNFSQQA